MYIFSADTQEEEEEEEDRKLKAILGYITGFCLRKWGGAHVRGVVDAISSQFIIIAPHAIIGCQTFAPTATLCCELCAHHAIKR